MNENAAKREIIETACAMLAKGLVQGTGGNFSVRCARGMIITPSGMDYASLLPEDITEVSLSGGRVLSGERRPSTETALHLAVYAARDDVNAIVHTHAAESTAFAVTGRTVPVITDEAAQVLRGAVRTAEYALPGARELAERSVEALGAEAMACLLRSHGAVCLGPDLKKALACALVLEQTCEVYRLALSMGGPAEPFPPDRVERMKRFLQNSYGQKQS